MIPIFKPWFGEEEVEAVREVLLSGWVGAGPKVEELELQFSKYMGAQCSVALNSCSAALFLALKVLDVEGGEVITTPMTFVSSNHAILQNGARPVFCDIDPETLNIDPESIASNITDKTRAIMVVHFSGHPCDMDPILRIARSSHLPIVEDAAHACGAHYNEKLIGGLGNLTCFSFQAVKNLSTCDGGMLTTNDVDLAERVRRLRWMGITRETWDRFGQAGINSSSSWDYDVSEVGFKFQMNDLNAAIGLLQLQKLEEANIRRRKVFLEYGRAFSNLDWFQCPIEKSYARSSLHAYIARVADRSRLIAHLLEREITAGVHYKPNHLHSIYEPYRRKLPITESVWKELVTLPLYPNMTQEEMGRVIEAVRCFRPTGQLLGF